MTEIQPETLEERVDILIVDDDDAIRGLLAEIFHGCGYSVLTAENGKTALSLLKRRRFRLVITDIFMPDLDGLELIMKYSSVHPKIPIFALSGGHGPGGPDGVLLPAKYLGCWRTFSKPFELADLRAAVKEQLG